MTAIANELGNWLPYLTGAISIIGALVSLWSFLRTRNRYYRDFVSRRRK